MYNKETTSTYVWKLKKVNLVRNDFELPVVLCFFLKGKIKSYLKAFLYVDKMFGSFFLLNRI